MFKDDSSFPAEWLAHVYPRRGGVTGSTLPEPDDGSLWKRLVKAATPEMTRVAGLSDTERKVVKAARDESSPEFAGFVLALWWSDLDTKGAPADIQGVADSLIAACGLEFACKAFVESTVFDIKHYRKKPVLWLGDKDTQDGSISKRLDFGGRLRARLIELSDDGDAVSWLKPLRSWPLDVRCAATFLVPSMADWYEADWYNVQKSMNHRFGVACLVCSTSGFQDVEILLKSSREWKSPAAYGGEMYSPSIVATIYDGVGPDFASVLVKQWDELYDNVDNYRCVADILGHIPNDEAMKLMVDRPDNQFLQTALSSAISSEPVKAARALVDGLAAGGKVASNANEWLQELVAEHGDELEQSDDVTDDVKAKIAAVRQSIVRLPDADVADVPPLLVSPPWEGERAPLPDTVLKLTAPTEIIADWLPGEREQILNQPWTGWDKRTLAEHPDPVAWGASLQGIKVDSSWVHLFLATAPLELVMPIIGDGGEVPSWDSDVVDRMVARFDTEVAARIATRLAGSNRGLLAPFVSTDIARIVSDWMTKKSTRQHAETWMRRHGADAPRYLLPLAFGRKGKVRTNAEGALRWLVANGFSDQVHSAAIAYGDACEKGVGALLAVDPLVAALPLAMPKQPQWLRLAALPQITLTSDGAQALPASAVTNLITMAQVSSLSDPYPGLEMVAADLDGLAAWARAIFNQWRTVGYVSADGWVLDLQGLFGDNETARLLTPLMRDWPQEGGHQRAVRGLDVLSAIGTDVALMQLNGLSLKTKTKGLKDAAGVKIKQLADERGLTPEELADRLAPTFDLDANGTTTLDFGDKQFTIGFDEALRPVIYEEGKVRKSLPKAATEPGLSQAKRFADLKKDIRAVASQQIARLEQAMVSQRTWKSEDFIALLVEHPLVWNITKRLVWTYTTSPESSFAEAPAFRVAEDRTFADAQDEELILPADAKIRIAHPLTLGSDEIAAWSSVFADYEILQPFQQLARDTHTLDEAAQFDGLTVETPRVFGLESRGWRRGDPEDAGGQNEMLKLLSDGRTLRIDLNPGIFVGASMSEQNPTQKLGPLMVDDVRFADAGLGAITISEAIRDLLSLHG